MPSAWLSNLKIRTDHLVGGLVAAALVIGGVWMWRSLQTSEEQAQLDEGLERLRDNRDADRSKRRSSNPGDRRLPIFKGYHTSAHVEQGEGKAVHRPPPQADPGDLDADDAVDAYRSVLADLEAAVDRERALSERERGELYNRASGSLVALTAWANPNDPNDRELMDDAYLQLKSLMRELNLKPPRHDPDPPPMIR